MAKNVQNCQQEMFLMTNEIAKPKLVVKICGRIS